MVIKNKNIIFNSADMQQEAEIARKLDEKLRQVIIRGNYIQENFKNKKIQQLALSGVLREIDLISKAASQYTGERRRTLT